MYLLGTLIFMFIDRWYHIENHILYQNYIYGWYIFIRDVRKIGHPTSTDWLQTVIKILQLIRNLLQPPN